MIIESPRTKREGNTTSRASQGIHYLFVFSIAVCFKAFWGMQLDGAAADDLDAAFLVLHTQRSYTTVHLSRRGGCGYSFTTPKLIM